MKRMTMLFLMALALPVEAELFKWTSKGQVVFGDTPPKGVSYEPVLLRGKESNTPPVVAQSPQPGLTDESVGSATMVLDSAPAPVNPTDALAEKRKADAEAKAFSKKQCNEAIARTNQLLALPVNKRPADFDERVMASKKDTAAVCR